MTRAAALVALLALLACAAPLLLAGAAHAQEVVHTTYIDGGGGEASGPTVSASEFVTAGDAMRLELVLEDDAIAPRDLEVVTSTGRLLCHVPCALDVPRGELHLLGDFFDQRLELDLPAARFRVRAGEPVPWLEAIGGVLAGGVLLAAGIVVTIQAEESSELAGGVTVTVLGGALLIVAAVGIGLAVAGQSGSMEFEELIEALQSGTLARF